MTQDKSSLGVALPPAPSQAEKQSIPPPPMEKTVPDTHPLVVKVVDDFSISVNGSFTQFKKGAVIADHNLAKYLLEQKCFVVPVDSGEYSVCPQCKHFYKR